ncbi:MAG TPA: biotin/lipoyl-containing protein [Thermoleophilaceae bacterium]|jgi:acetyl-CoA carboxylase biotin carboxyl carrier protein
MSDDRELIESTWAEARDLVRRLEGTSVQRFAVKAGDYKIEIERGGLVQAAVPVDGGGIEVPAFAGPVATGAGPGLGVSGAARAASGAFSVSLDQADMRIPVLAPLVGTFYRSAQPGSPPFAEVGDVVEIGQTVCIVEAMKLMNEVAAGEGGKVAEILVENGEPVEFEQVLMYLEPAGE